MRFAHPITVTVRRRVRDAFGDATVASETSIGGCAVLQRTSEETTNNRQDVTTRVRLLAPFSAAITAHDEVEICGQRYEVVGEPSRPHSPFSGWRPGMIADLERVTG